MGDLVVITGGLGPTADDITREGVAHVLQLPLDENESVVTRIRERFARRGMTMPEINRRQGMVPRGATLLENPNGTAPGLWLEHGSTGIVLLPGPPREMKPMFESVIRDRLASRTGGTGLFRRVLKITGRSESEVDTIAQPIYERWLSEAVPITTTILAVMGQIELHLTASAASRAAADRALDPAVEQLQAALAEAVYSTDGSSLEAVVGARLRERHLTIAVAESCTGGLLSSRLTDVPGSSDYFERGEVCYSNRTRSNPWRARGIDRRARGGERAGTRAMAKAFNKASTGVGIGATGIADREAGRRKAGWDAVAIAVLAGATATCVRFNSSDRARWSSFNPHRPLSTCCG